jgi:LPXTG-motif cell wall-anchored protein
MLYLGLGAIVLVVLGLWFFVFRKKQGQAAG